VFSMKENKVVVSVSNRIDFVINTFSVRYELSFYVLFRPALPLKALVRVHGV
jgi:hypothetical protein